MAVHRGAQPLGWERLGALLALVALVALVALLGAACASPGVGSIGAVLGRDRDSGALHVREAPEGMAAAEAGLLPGDQVKMIDGVLVDDLDKARIHALLRGEVGTKVKLTIVRGEEVLHVELTRGPLRKAEAPAEPEERIEP
jgi:C-terminal processing protease CtpA/Prc